MLHNEIAGLHGSPIDVFRPPPATSSVFASIDIDEDDEVDRERNLRDFCCRIYGWSNAQAALVDDVMCTLLAAVDNCAVIALRGESDLVPIAYALHRQLFGSQRPFVVCDSRRHEGDGSVRTPPNRRTSARALDAATRGSVCIRSRRLPPDYQLLAPSRRHPTGTQLFLCLDRDDPVIDILCPPIRIPSLAQRASDLDRLINEYVADATHMLRMSSLRLTRRMRDAILWRTESLADLEKVVTRVVALTSAPNISRAAALLGMAPVSLSRWAARRGLREALGELVRNAEDDEGADRGWGAQL